jgi:transposase
MGVTGSMKKDFSDEYKKQCVETYKKRGKRSLDDVATDLGIGRSTLSRWVKELAFAAVSSEGSVKADVLRILQLEKENQQQRLEIEFLKKITLYFAKETPQQFKKS